MHLRFRSLFLGLTGLLAAQLLAPQAVLAQAAQGQAAQGQAGSDPLGDCMMSQAEGAELQICVDRALLSLDAGMRLVVKDILGALQPEHKPAFEAAQKSWETWRDNECRFARLDGVNREAAHMVETVCRASMAEERIESLEAWIDDQPEADGKQANPAAGTKQ